MECTDKEWQTCRVEKMGCEGCYYNQININKDKEMLEKLARAYREKAEHVIPTKYGDASVELYGIANAIENLLTGYKELEEENNRIRNLLIHYRIFYYSSFGKPNIDVIPISAIQNKIDEITKYRDLAKELIERKVVIADSDSLNYGRAEAHNKDIEVLQELLKGRKK